MGHTDKVLILEKENKKLRDLHISAHERDDDEDEARIVQMRKAHKQGENSEKSALATATDALWELFPFQVGSPVIEGESNDSEAQRTEDTIDAPIRGDQATFQISEDAGHEATEVIAVAVEESIEVSPWENDQIQLSSERTEIEDSLVPTVENDSVQVPVSEDPPPHKVELKFRDAGTVATEDASLKHLVARYIDQDDTVLCWHLLSLAEERGIETPVHSSLLKAVVLGPTTSQAEDIMDRDHIHTLSDALSGLQGALDESAAELLAFAALLRPALFDTGVGTRAQLASLPRDGILSTQTPLIDALANLGYEIRPKPGDFADLAGMNRTDFSSQALAALREWLDSTRKRKTAHQPTYTILHKELRTNGKLGSLIEGVIAGDQIKNEEARSFVKTYRDNRSAQEGFVAEAQRRRGRPRRNRIEGIALNWFCDRLADVCDLLADYLEANDAARQKIRDRSRKDLQRSVGVLKKAIDEARSGEVDCQTHLQSVALGLLHSEQTRLRELITGHEEAITKRRGKWLFADPLLRLPGGCQDWTDGLDEFEDERAAAREKRFVALCDPSSISVDYRTALEHRLAEWAILPAEELLKRCPRGEIVHHLRQNLDERANAARSDALKQVDSLRQSFASLSYLDSDHVDQIRRHLNRLSLIAEALVPQLRSRSLR